MTPRVVRAPDEGRPRTFSAKLCSAIQRVTGRVAAFRQRLSRRRRHDLLPPPRNRAVEKVRKQGPQGSLALLDDVQAREAYYRKIGLERAPSCRTAGRLAAVCARKAGDGLPALSSIDSQSEPWRMRYLQKLSYDSVWVPRVQRPKPQETLIVFDWDDTLLCTNFISSLPDLQRLSPTVRAIFRTLEPAVKKLLEKALSLGQVIIITNADAGWVESSAEIYMPGLVSILRNIRIVSARDKYQAWFPEDHTEWKLQAFLDVQRELDPNTVMNMVALGDAEYEIDAARNLRGIMAHSVVKTIKFCPNPTPKQLLRQLQFVTRRLQNVVHSAQDRSHQVPCCDGYGKTSYTGGA